MARKEVVRGETVGTIVSNIDENFKELYNAADDLSESIDNIVEGITSVGKATSAETANKVQHSLTINVYQGSEKNETYNGSAAVTIGDKDNPVMYAYNATYDANGNHIVTYYAKVSDLNDLSKNLSENYLTTSDFNEAIADYSTTESIEAKYATISELELVKTIAEGKAKGFTFVDLDTMLNSVGNAPKSAYKVGDSIYIKDANVPDWWVSAVYDETTAEPDITSENANTISSGRVGYFELSVLETQKVDLADYYTKEQTNSAISSSVTTLQTNITNGTVVAKNATTANKVANTLTLGAYQGSVTTVAYDGSSAVEIGTQNSPVGYAYQAAYDGSGNNISETYATKAEVETAIANSAVYTKMIRLTGVGTSYTETAASLQFYVPVVIFNSNWQMLLVDVSMGTNGYFTITSDKALGTIYVLLNYFNIDDIS